ncbi:MAG: hypothetical protein QME90_00745 [Thermodesulfobacteriota bacterium]|nr:hypothetical protein [Thermodesulfobacteriota bacterium]
MTDSVVVELQREALDKKVPIADLLRKALVKIRSPLDNLTLEGGDIDKI